MISKQRKSFNRMYRICYFRLAIFTLLEVSTEAVFIKSREESKWASAREHCTLFGGHLATLNDLVGFRNNAEPRETILFPGDELWVGAVQRQNQWKWKGGIEEEFNDDARFYVRKGCLQHDQWHGGTEVENLTPVKCLSLCQWQDLVGLQNDHCICKSELNVSVSRPGICHIRCNHNATAMCGGYSAVSLYKPGIRRISWASGEPRVKYDCAYLNKGGRNSKAELVSGNCDMHARFLCSFYDDDDKCGVYRSCIRWSTTHATWNGAVQECLALNGSLTGLHDSHTDDTNRKLARLPSGAFWVALRRERVWQWINGQSVRPADFHFRMSASQGRTCATVRNIGGKIALMTRQCQTKLYYLCQYDYMTKRDDMGPVAGTVPAGTTGLTPEYRESSASRPPVISRNSNYGEIVFGVEDETVTEEWPSEKRGLVSTCMYVILGFASGMVCVLLIGLIIYLMYRCIQPKEDKHTRLDDQKCSRQDIHSVNYCSKDESVHISPPHSDITYDTVYNLETESPFRRTQRLIRMGSANSWRHAQSHRMQPDETHSPGSSYTWRGMIGGDVEMINTELRHQETDQSGFRNYNSATSHESTRAFSNHHDARPVQNQHDFDQIEVLYDWPERSNSFDFEKNKRCCGKNPTDPRFLELLNSSDTNDETIYATVKKAFQKIKDDIVEQSRKATDHDDNDNGDAAADGNDARGAYISTLN